MTDHLRTLLAGAFVVASIACAAFAAFSLATGIVVLSLGLAAIAVATLWFGVRVVEPKRRP